MDAELIQSDPAVMMGKPVVAGTRITVELILEKLSAGGRLPPVHPGEVLRTTDTALRLGRYFGIGPEFWTNLQTRYDLEVAEREVQPRTA